MPGHKVIVDGTLANQPVEQINWTFVLSLVDGKGDESLISNIKIGQTVEAFGKPGQRDYRPKVPARSLTCLHCTQRGQNFTVFYRRVDASQIRVIGYGKHTTNNQNYRVDWSDGSTTAVDLKQTSMDGTAFLA